jgi:DNA-binding MarR family transcriptional regulator
LSCSNLISGELRRRLRAEYDVTLPRFDVMAQLNRAPEGLRLSDLSRRMMVTNGNVTGLIDRLVEEGVVARAADPTDRRATTVRLTRAGAMMFKVMAKSHEAWVGELFGALDAAQIDRLLTDLQALKASAQKPIEAARAAEGPR